MEAEWEYACRAGTVTDYAIGDDKCLLAKYAVYASSLSEVCGTRLPNGWGLFDCHGHTWEWRSDWKSLCGSGKDVSDPMGPARGNSRVLHDGAWDSNVLFILSATKLSLTPVGRHSFRYGSRVARTYPLIGVTALLLSLLYVVSTRHRAALTTVSGRNRPSWLYDRNLHRFVGHPHRLLSSPC